MNTKKSCILYGLLTLFLLIIEVLIALYVRDAFIRPYGGDILVTILLCCFLRMIFLKKIPFIPLWVFLISILVEIGQYFGFVYLIGLGHIRFFRLILGTGFSFVDILCYGVGCVLFFIAEKILEKLSRKP
jgi:hypothetical protein